MASLEELRKVRLEKLEELRKRGLDPYPAEVNRTHTAYELFSSFDSLIKKAEPIFIAGRVRGIRRHGGAAFFDVEDESGQFQVFAEEKKLNTELVDIGDFVEVSGTLFKTQKDEKTLRAESFKVIVKALRPVPEEWFGLKDVEERLRKRYLDLLVNKGVKETLKNRSRIVKAVRAYCDAAGFTEVETPMLQPIPSGAAARPFKTYFNAYNTNVFLRIAPELYLKRLLVGGFEKVYEIGRIFRNEGVSPQHNPEFTMLELYAAYRDYEWMMGFMEELVRQAAKELYGRLQFEYEGNNINTEPTFKRVTFNEVLKEYAGVDWEDGKGKQVDEIYKKTCRPKIIQPTFVTLLPLELSPLAKQGNAPAGYTERFNLIIGGMEIMNGFSELNDSIDQRSRFEAQEKLRRAGDEEIVRQDEDFLEALEYGMPPAAGVGVGIDRLVAILTNNHSIRDVIVFPFTKPR